MNDAHAAPLLITGQRQSKEHSMRGTINPQIRLNEEKSR
jgi:hypothetical protein